jgi:hypothetical protein
MALTHKQREEEERRRTKEGEEIIPLLQELVRCPEVRDLIKDVEVTHNTIWEDGEYGGCTLEVGSILLLTTQGLMVEWNGRKTPAVDLMKCVHQFPDLTANTVRRLIDELRK